MKLITHRLDRDVVLVSLLLMTSCSGAFLPSDKTLEERFRSNQAEFEKIIGMLNEDNDVVRITSKYVFLSENSTRQLPKERLDEYRRLMKELKLEGGIQRHDSERVLLIASASGIALPNAGKCYAYSLKEPQPIVESLDELIKGSSGDHSLVYKKLRGNWYLCYESW